MPTITQIHNLLNSKFNGTIKSGGHDEDGECCILELCSVLHGVPWTDNPTKVRCFDIRSMNDINVSDSLRTKWMSKLLVAYDGSLDWSKDKQKAVVTEIIIETVKQIVAELPGLTDEVREQCRNVKTLEEARLAARVAYAANAYDAAAYTVAYVVARAAARAAYSAARAARAARADVREQVFVTACKIWLKAADRNKN